MNYTSVIDSALAYVDNNNADTFAKCDVFLRIVEAAINRVLTTKKMVKTLQIVGVPNQISYNLPSDFLSFRDVTIQSSTSAFTLTYVPPEQLFNSLTEYTIIGLIIQIHPISELQTLNLTYFTYVPALTTERCSNWLSITHPDCYVFGLAAEICSYLKDFEAAAFWSGRFENTLLNIELQDDMSTHSGASLYTKAG